MSGVNTLDRIKDSHHPRKLKIVETAINCFLERGYHQTGVRVLVFIAEMEHDELAGLIKNLKEASVSPIERMRDFIGAYAHYSQQPENALLSIEILTEALRNTTIADVFELNRCALVEAVIECLVAGVENGVFARFENQNDVADMILDTIEGYGLRSVLSSPPSANSLEKFLLSAIQI